MYLKKEPIPNERKRDFIVGHYIIISDFFCLIMFYEPQTWNPMANKKLHITYVVYIDFIQSFSSKYWIEINLDLSETWVPKCWTFYGFLFIYRISNDAIKI
jgi:hypothetical protein